MRSGGGNCDEVVYFGYHSADCGGVFFDDCMVHFVKTQCIECAFLHCGAVDAAFGLCDFDVATEEQILEANVEDYMDIYKEEYFDYINEGEI